MDIASKLWDESIRAEKVLWLDGQTTCPTSALREFFSDQDMTTAANKALWESLTGGKIKWSEVEDELQTSANRDAVEELLGNLAGGGPTRPIGFLVQVATPTPLSFDEQGRRGAYSWGSYACVWMHTKALDGVFVEAAVAWKNDYVAKCYAASKKGKKG